MNDLTPEQRARALELYRLYHYLRSGHESEVTGVSDMLPKTVRAWLAMEAHVLASHTCPDAEGDDYPEPACLIHDASGEDVRGWEMAECICPDPEPDARVKAWNAIAQHPFFAACYQTEGTLIDAMLAKLDAAHNHTCKPVWRPTTAEEIQPGWEVRARLRDGVEATWGVAHHRDDDGDWCTETGRQLTFVAAGWTYETTAPAPEPKPWPDELVEALADTMATTTGGTTWEDDARAVLDLLAAKFPGIRDAITGGEQ